MFATHIDTYIILFNAVQPTIYISTVVDITRYWSVFSNIHISYTIFTGYMSSFNRIRTSMMDLHFTVLNIGFVLQGIWKCIIFDNQTTAVFL